MRNRWFCCTLLGLAVAPFSCSTPPPQRPTTPPKKLAASKVSKKPKIKHTTETVRGKIVWLADALQRRYGVKLDPDAKESMVVLETTDGELLPIMKEDRGRGFWRDARIRNIDMELMVRRYQGSPVVQVIRVYTLKKGKKYELDYWCDICAIPMYELKECECCQGPIRIRQRLVEGEAKP